MGLQANIPDEMRKRYLERRAADVNALADALAKQDLEVFDRIGHQLKGNAETFGYSDLAEIAFDLEIAGRARDLRVASRALEAMKNWLTSQSKGA